MIGTFYANEIWLKVWKSAQSRPIVSPVIECFCLISGNYGALTQSLLELPISLLLGALFAPFSEEKTWKPISLCVTNSIQEYFFLCFKISKILKEFLKLFSQLLKLTLNFMKKNFSKRFEAGDVLCNVLIFLAISASMFWEKPFRIKKCIFRFYLCSDS